MNVGILSVGIPPERIGGAEVQAVGLAGQLASHHRVKVFTRSRLAGVSSTTTPYLVVQRCRSRIPGFRFAIDIPSTLRLLANERHSIDVLIAFQTVIDGLIGVLARRLFGIPVIVSVRSEQEYDFRRRWQTRWFGPFVYRSADRIAVQSPTIERSLLAALRDSGRDELGRDVASKLFVLPNGIVIPDATSEAEAEAGADSDVLYVGRLVAVKGVRYLVDAMKACPEERLVIVGDGPERANLERQAQGLNNIEFAGRVDRSEVDAYYRRAKLLVLPSLRGEGLPNVILEAMARGIPVVASRDAGTPDLVKSGVTGFLTEPGDSKAIAHYIERIAGDENLRRRLGANSISAVEPYTWPRVLALLEEQLETLTSNTGPRPSPVPRA